MSKEMPFADRHIEAKLSSIGAKVVKASENSATAQKLCEESNQLLIDAQTEIADLYESLGDVLAAPTPKKGPQKAALKVQVRTPAD